MERLTTSRPGRAAPWLNDEGTRSYATDRMSRPWKGLDEKGM